MPTIDNWRALQETVSFAERIQAQSLEMDPAAIRSLLDERDSLAAEQHVMRQWIAEALPVLGSIDSEGECRAVNSEATLQFLYDMCESGRRLVDGGPDDLLKGVE